MNKPWYLSRNGQQFGPYDWRDLVDLFHAGNLLPEDMLWNPNTQQWEHSNMIDFSNVQKITVHHPTMISKKWVYVSLGALMIVVLLVGITFSWRNQSRTAFLSGKSRDPATMDSKASQNQDNDEFGFILNQFESSIHEKDFMDWRNFNDLKQEQDSIKKTLDSFIHSLKQKDADTAVAMVEEERKEAYRELLNSRPEAMESFADIISKAEMSFLSAHSPDEPKNRTAEYKVILDDFTFYVIFMKIDDEWVLYDF